MIHLCFYDTKPYDRVYFDAYASGMGVEIEYLESKLTRVSAVMARGADAVCAFVNDTIDAAAIETLCENGVKLLALRCAGYNNVDLRALRASVLYNADANKLEYRKSHDNPLVKKVYEEFLGEPNSHKAHELLHTNYVKRGL